MNRSTSRSMSRKASPSVGGVNSSVYNVPSGYRGKNGLSFDGPAQARQAWNTAMSAQARRMRQTCVQGTGCDSMATATRFMSWPSDEGATDEHPRSFQALTVATGSPSQGARPDTAAAVHRRWREGTQQSDPKHLRCGRRHIQRCQVHKGRGHHRSALSQHLPRELSRRRSYVSHPGTRHDSNKAERLLRNLARRLEHFQHNRASRAASWRSLDRFHDPHRHPPRPAINVNSGLIAQPAPSIVVIASRYEARCAR